MNLPLEQIAENFQIVTADIRFLTAEEGGRRTPIDPSLDSLYRPHMVMQDRNTRQTLHAGNQNVEPYIAVTFFEGPRNYRNGEIGGFRFYCPYWTHPNHPPINPGTEFTIREGGKIVAGGIVVGKTEPKHKIAR